MAKWVVLAVIAILVIIVAVGEKMEDEYYRGYMAGIAECEKMMRKEKDNGQEDKSKSV